MPGLAPLNQEAFESQVRQAELPVLVAFSASRCGPCQQVRGDLTELAEEYAGRVQFYSVDAGLDSDLMVNYGVIGLPALILFRAGEPVKRITGYRPKHAVEKALLADLE
ncbi:MAG: thioredoxin family protein [Brevefilum sp.]|nr:thioredoxin family protein [Brevefilum sp.]